MSQLLADQLIARNGARKVVVSMQNGVFDLRAKEESEKRKLEFPFSVSMKLIFVSVMCIVLRDTFSRHIL